MRIAINIDGQFQTMTGVQNYVDSLLRALAASGTKHEIAAFAPLLGSPEPLHDAFREGRFAWGDAHAADRIRVDSAGTAALVARLPGVAGRPRLRSLAHRLDARLPAIKRATVWRRSAYASRRYDVMHLPATNPLPYEQWRAKNFVVTIYDMTIRLFAEAHAADNIAAWNRLFDFAKNRCARILTISEASRRDIVRLLDVPEERVVVTPLAPRASVRPVPPDAARREAARVLDIAPDVPFVLYAGSLEKRKNLAQLVKSFAQATCDLPSAPRLVLAGHGWDDYGARLRDLARDCGVADRLILPGYVPNEPMNALLSACTVFAYVSEYEGFGLPPLEAMACGAPVVASNVSSLPEVVGEAGIQVAPQDTEAIAAALKRLLTDGHENARRRELSRARAALFSWERTAALTLGAYEAAAAASAP